MSPPPPSSSSPSIVAGGRVAGGSTVPGGSYGVPGAYGSPSPPAIVGLATYNGQAHDGARDPKSRAVPGSQEDYGTNARKLLNRVEAQDVWWCGDQQIPLLPVRKDNKTRVETGPLDKALEHLLNRTFPSLNPPDDQGKKRVRMNPVVVDSPEILVDVAFNLKKLVKLYPVNWKSGDDTNKKKWNTFAKGLVKNDYDENDFLRATRLVPANIPQVLAKSHFHERPKGSSEAAPIGNTTLVKPIASYSDYSNEETTKRRQTDKSVLVVEYYVNFTDQMIFRYGETDRFASEEITAFSHPSLISLRDCLEDLSDHVLGEKYNTWSVSGAIKSLGGKEPKAGSYLRNWGQCAYTIFQVRQIFRTAYTAFRGAVNKAKETLEYHKALKERNQYKNVEVVIHTGDWGTGEFGGDLVVMAFLQIAAAHAAGVNSLYYHSTNDEAKHVQTAEEFLMQVWQDREIRTDVLFKFLVDKGRVWKPLNETPKQPAEPGPDTANDMEITD
ncbi:hypothetical protein DFJ73DRAFT_929409 [Zopfochytrium polystomum]|nr:hypothetical protein DFJ73DRAFT_929409 [Zopfochytrium polystomum]